MNDDARLLDLIGCNDRALGCKYVLLLKREKWTCRRFKHDHEHWFSYNRLNVFDQEWCYPHNECRRQAIEPEDDSWTSTYNFVFFFADLGFAWELSPLSSFQFNLFLFGSGMLIQWLFYNYFRNQIQLVFSQEEGSFDSRWIIPLIISMPDLEDIYVIIGHSSLYWRKWRYSDKGSNKCTLNI